MNRIRSGTPFIRSEDTPNTKRTDATPESRIRSPGSTVPSYTVHTASTSELMRARGSSIDRFPAQPEGKTPPRDTYGWTGNGSKVVSNAGIDRFIRQPQPVGDVQKRSDLGHTNSTKEIALYILNVETGGEVDVCRINGALDRLQNDPTLKESSSQPSQTASFLINLRDNDGLQRIINAVGSEFR